MLVRGVWGQPGVRAVQEKAWPDSLRDARHARPKTSWEIKGLLPAAAPAVYSSLYQLEYLLAQSCSEAVSPPL